MPKPFYIRPRSEFDTLGESRNHAYAVADASQFFGRTCLLLSGVEAGFAGLYTTPIMYPSGEGVPFSAVSAGVLAVTFALSSRLSFVIRNRALLRATELPHEFSDVRDAELAALAAEQQAVGQGPEKTSVAAESMPGFDNGQTAVLSVQPENLPPSSEPGQPESPRSPE